MAQTAPLIALSEITNRRGRLIDLLGAVLRQWVGVGAILPWGCLWFSASSCSNTQSVGQVSPPCSREIAPKQASLAPGWSLSLTHFPLHSKTPTLKRKLNREKFLESSEVSMATNLRLGWCRGKDYVELAGGGRGCLSIAWSVSEYLTGLRKTAPTRYLCSSQGQVLGRKHFLEPPRGDPAASGICSGSPQSWPSQIIHLFLPSGQVTPPCHPYPTLLSRKRDWAWIGHRSPKKPSQ